MNKLPALLFGFACATLLQAMGAPAIPPKETIMLPVRDGIKLATDLHKPDVAGAFPVVLCRTPYNKDGLAGIGKQATERGYVFVSQDTRGRFASEGENLPFHLDMHDGKDTVDWIARQPWCNGQIGTWGGSAGAITQFQLVAGGAEGIDSQYLIVGAPNLYDVVYINGLFRKALIEDWIRLTKFQSNALSIWVNHPLYDDYWRARDATRNFKNASAPAVHVGGYWDIFAQATIDGFNGYHLRGGQGARGQQKLIMGPWTHGVLAEKAGELKFPGASKPPGQAHDSWAWFDATLKNLTNAASAQPAVTYYVIGDVTDTNAPGNTWRTADAWPPLKTRDTKYYLQSDRSLSASKSSDAGTLEYTYQPTNPVPTVGGIQLSIPAGPMDQQKVEAREDVLVFSSEPLTEPLEVTGRVRARLWIETDAPDTDLVVKLCDVYPDGRSFNLCEGVVRARFRNGLEKEELMKPGRVYPMEVDLWSTSAIFNRGHRLRVQVTSSSSPGFDPNPNTGHAFRSTGEQRPAKVKLHVGARRDSHLLLPVAP